MNSTFLVENYSPGSSVDALEAASRRVCAEIEGLARVGKRVRMLRTAIVPEDESLLCLLDAASEDLVREAFTRAGVAFDRISVALSSPKEAIS
jgi:Protein of unknown function (DUF4242)